MVKFKVNTAEDDQDFRATTAYKKLYARLKDLKTRKGRIIHVIGAPGTGKSANIFQAVKDLDLNVYNAVLALDDIHQSSTEVYNKFFDTLKEDMKVNSIDGVFDKASEYDAVLLADRFHDSHYLYEGKIGFSLWMDNKGFGSFPFYFSLIILYFRNLSKFRKVNLVFQTAWTFRTRGVKKDLFTDFGLFSRLMVSLLKLFFDVVEISYSESEIIDIVKKRIPDVEAEEIRSYIERYGNRIRFILKAIEKSQNEHE